MYHVYPPEHDSRLTRANAVSAPFKATFGGGGWQDFDSWEACYDYLDAQFKRKSRTAPYAELFPCAVMDRHERIWADTMHPDIWFACCESPVIGLMYFGMRIHFWEKPIPEDYEPHERYEYAD